MTATLDAGRSPADPTPSESAALPAQLAPFADPDQVRTRYPVVLLPPGTDRAGRCAVSIGDLLPELLAASTRGGGGLLADNLVRLEAWIRSQARDARGPLDAATAMKLAAQAMSAALALPAGPAEDLRKQLDALVAAVPAGSRLLPYLPRAPLWLLHHATNPMRAAARAAWREDVHQVRNALAGLIDVERAKDPDAAGAAGVADRVGDFGASFLDPAALARVVGPPRGSRRMEPARRARIERQLETLDRALAAPDGPTLVVLGTTFEAEGVVALRSTDPCTDAAVRFDTHVSGLIETVGAVRAARLEVAGAYDPATHDPQVAALDWWHLTPEELQLLPVVVAIEDAERVVHDDIVSLTRLLGSGRPVQIVVDVQTTRNPGASAGPLAGFRVELGRVGMALRQAVVQQSTPARPEHLVAGFQRATGGPRAGLHLLCSGWLADGRTAAPGAWMTAASAVESRAHALFRYDPDAGDSWADCLDAADNPQPEADWVVPGDSPEADGPWSTQPYTFADHALLDPQLAHHFTAPPAGESEALLPVAPWLALDAEEAGAYTPIVIAVVDGERQPMAISEALAFACRDRLHSWRSLRELAGYANQHARRAADQARAEAEAEATTEREALIAAHRAELERVRAEAAAEAMGRLASALLDRDWSGASPLGRTPAPQVTAVAPAAQGPAAASVEAAPAPAPEPAAEEDEDEAAEEAWIDSALCTSCNDCIDVNGLLFIYDGNKQAVIGDLAAGTYEELVRAAEACPARCIHPGAPTNPDEPRLDELVARAARFN